MELAREQAVLPVRDARPVVAFAEAQRRRLSRIALGVYFCGALFRIWWLFYEHVATQFTYSDMRLFVEGAKRWANPNYQLTIIDTLGPPATQWFLAATYLLDPTWRLALVLQLVMSLAIPLLIGAIGEELFGWRAGRWALIVSSLYFPFIDYAAFFISENPFLFSMLLGFLLLLIALRAASARNAALLAVASGLCCGVAAEFKSQALVSALFVAALLAYTAWRFKWRRMWLVIAGAVAGTLLIVAPVAVRQTRLNNGKFCLVSTGVAQNFLVGHDPDAGTVIFEDKARHYTGKFTPPPLAERHVQHTEKLEMGPYEEGKLMNLAWERIEKKKIDALGLSVDHVFELFIGFTPWPTSGTVFRRAMTAFQQLFLVFLLLPAVCHLWLNWRAISRCDPEFLADILLIAPVLGLMALAFVVIGEARYRVPFDAFIMLLSLRYYLRGREPVANVFTRAALASGRAPTLPAIAPPPRVLIETSEDAQRRRLALVTLVVFGLGVWFRYWWILKQHRAIDFLYSDMEMYVNYAKRWAQADPHYTIYDTMCPPGNSLYLAGLSLLDPSWELSMFLAWLMSVAIPLLSGAIARELYGWRIGLWTVIIMSVYYPVIDLAGFYVAENPFIFLLLLSFWLLLRSLSGGSRFKNWTMALVSGVALAWAIEFKAQAVLPGFFIAMLLAYAAWRFQMRRIWPVFACVALGSAAVLAPMSARATRLNEGHFCFVSTNGALNVLLGHDPNAGTLYMTDPVRGWLHIVTPPPIAERGIERVTRLPYGPYENDKIMKVAWDTIMNNKLEALGLSFDNVFEVFVGFAPWPSSGTGYRRVSIAFQQLFVVLLLLPACIHVITRWRPILRCEPAYMADVVMLIPIAGLIATAFLAFGEGRYRLPFEPFIIMLALRFYTRGHEPAGNVFTRAAEAAAG